MTEHVKQAIIAGIVGVVGGLISASVNDEKKTPFKYFISLIVGAVTAMSFTTILLNWFSLPIYWQYGVAYVFGLNGVWIAKKLTDNPMSWIRPLIDRVLPPKN